MALSEHEKEELVVGLYARGDGLDPSRRILDIGTSKILKSEIWSPYLVNFRPVLSVDEHSQVPIRQQKRIKTLFLEAMSDELSYFNHSLGFFTCLVPQKRERRLPVQYLA